MQLSARLAAFALALAAGSAAWHGLAAAQTQDTANGKTNVTNSNRADEARAHAHHSEEPSEEEAAEATGEESANETAEAETPATEESAAPGVKWSDEVQPAWGTPNATRVTLREGAAADSPVVARLQLPAYDNVEILDWTRERVKVKFAANKDAEGGTRERDYVGWVAWSAVKPGALAVVIDAETGEVFARVPLASNITAATFSPDGRRVLFQGDGSGVAYEASVKDYRPARVLESGATGGFGPLFYGADGELRAPVWTVDYEEEGTRSTLDLFRVGASGEAARTRLASKEATKLLVAPEGRVALVVRGESVPDAWGPNGLDSTGRRATVEVLDLETLELRNTFTLYGEDAPDQYAESALSRDGAELYVKTAAGTSVVVFDTRSGARLREITLGTTDAGWTLPSAAVSAGGPLLVNAWRTTEDGGGEQFGVWLGGEKPVEAEKGVDYAVEAGGALYAVNARGTELLKLDERMRVRERIKIERPDIGRDPEAETELTVFGLTASPDGKHLILFVGTPECGC